MAAIKRDDAWDWSPLRQFVARIGDLLDTAPAEQQILHAGGQWLAELIARDDWVPDIYARPDPSRYQQYLLYRDSRNRFSVVSFVWAPGQATPVHDHRVWGLVGVLRGAERVRSFTRGRDGALLAGPEEMVIAAGEVDAVSPRIGDIHQVANAYDDKVSVSIHVYGADIGGVERATYDPAGNPKLFISGYADAPLPDIA